MERIITATEANQRFSEVLREVSAGESFTVTSRGKPVAEIKPPQSKTCLNKAEMAAFWDSMDELPEIVSGPRTRDELYER